MLEESYIVQSFWQKGSNKDRNGMSFFFKIEKLEGFIK